MKIFHPHTNEQMSSVEDKSQKPTEEAKELKFENLIITTTTTPRQPKKYKRKVVVKRDDTTPINQEEALPVIPTQSSNDETKQSTRLKPSVHTSAASSNDEGVVNAGDLEWTWMQQEGWFFII